MATELRKVGATVVETQDSISVTLPATRSTPTTTTGMAMCFSPAALLGTPV